jgi:hypothetical protein
MRVYIAPRGLWLTLDAGRFDEVDLNLATGVVRAGLAGATKETSLARLRIEQPVQLAGVGVYHTQKGFPRERDASVIPLEAGTTWVELIGQR